MSRCPGPIFAYFTVSHLVLVDRQIHTYFISCCLTLSSLHFSFVLNVPYICTSGGWLVTYTRAACHNVWMHACNCRCNSTVCSLIVLANTNSQCFIWSIRTSAATLQNAADSVSFRSIQAKCSKLPHVRPMERLGLHYMCILLPLHVPILP